MTKSECDAIFVLIGLAITAMLQNSFRENYTYVLTICHSVAEKLRFLNKEEL